MSLRFTTNGMVVPRFSLPTTIMDYAFENAKPEMFIKFNECCKYFYAKYRRNIIEDLAIGTPNNNGEVDGSIYDEIPTQSHTVARGTGDTSFLESLKDFWFIKSFISVEPIAPGIFCNFSHVFIKDLFCPYVAFEWQDFLALTKSGTIEELNIEKVYRDIPEVGNDNVTSTFRETVPLDEVFKAIPKASKINISESSLSKNSCSNLMRMERTSKVRELKLYSIDGTFHFNASNMVTFLIKNSDRFCHADIGLNTPTECCAQCTHELDEESTRSGHDLMADCLWRDFYRQYWNAGKVAFPDEEFVSDDEDEERLRKTHHFFHNV